MSDDDFIVTKSGRRASDFLGGRYRLIGGGAIVRFCVCAIFAVAFFCAGLDTFMDATDDMDGSSRAISLLLGVMFAALIVWNGIISDVIRHRRSKTAMAIAGKLAASDEPSVPYSRLGLAPGSEEGILRLLLSKRFLTNVLLDPDARALVIPGAEKAASVSYSCPTCGGVSNIDPARDRECPYCGVTIERLS